VKEYVEASPNGSALLDLLSATAGDDAAERRKEGPRRALYPDVSSLHMSIRIVV
jgi:hypothetical protein